MSQMLPYDENKIWHGHADVYINKLVEISNNTDDNDIGYFFEVDLNYPDNIEEKTKHFPICPEKKKLIPINILII